MNNASYKHNDVMFVYEDNVVTLSHVNNSFQPFQRARYKNTNWLYTVFTTLKQQLKVMLHTNSGYYFILNSEGLVVDGRINSYDKARDKANDLDTNYAEWKKEHELKGLTKKKLLDDVKAGHLKGKKTMCLFNGVNNKLDTVFHPLAKRKGVGSIDIVRNGKHSAIFYLDSTSANCILYDGKTLKIFDSAYRLLNEKEKEVCDKWESMRDLKAEYVDLISDGSQEFYRKKYFFKENDCEHLLRQTYDGLVKDPLLRGNMVLSYEIEI